MIWWKSQVFNRNLCINKRRGLLSESCPWTRNPIGCLVWPSLNVFSEYWTNTVHLIRMLILSQLKEKNIFRRMQTFGSTIYMSIINFDSNYTLVNYHARGSTYFSVLRILVLTPATVKKIFFSPQNEFIFRLEKQKVTYTIKIYIVHCITVVFYIPQSHRYFPQASVYHGEKYSLCHDCWIDLIHKSQNAPVQYPTMLHSEQKCAHFCSEWSIVGYGTGAFWDLWKWSIVWIHHIANNIVISHPDMTLLILPCSTI